MVFIYIAIKLLLLNKHFDDVDKEKNSTLVTVFSVCNSTVFFVYYFKTHKIQTEKLKRMVTIYGPPHSVMWTTFTTHSHKPYLSRTALTNLLVPHHLTWCYHSEPILRKNAHLTTTEKNRCGICLFGAVFKFLFLFIFFQNNLD